MLHINHGFVAANFEAVFHSLSIRSYRSEEIRKRIVRNDKRRANRPWQVFRGKIAAARASHNKLYDRRKDLATLSEMERRIAF